MARSKIDYGIDLGTTNSAISRMEIGEPVIKKTDTLKDTLPSCVFINKKGVIQVGDSAYNSMKRDKLKSLRNFNAKSSNSFIEFKRTMGTDKRYYSSYIEKEFTSEELSSEVLKKLKSFIGDEVFKAVVITVPAKFTINQKDATIRAAKLSGFQQVELLQEPIAASMAHGLDSTDKEGYWLVFDFGGGTFDAALVKVDEGIMKVVDTEGDNYLGGKNLDYQIVNEIIIPYIQTNYKIDSIIADDVKRKIFQDALKFYGEEAKIQLSFNDNYTILSDLGDIPGEDDEGEEFELDLTITREELKLVIAPIFQKAINICKDLLKRNNMSGESLNNLILVGGPTYSPILREMLTEQIRVPDVSGDPMTIVSKGAALFASTIDISDDIADDNRDSSKIQLDLGYESTTVEDEEFITVKPGDNVKDDFLVEIIRGDKAWSSGKVEIGGLGEVIEVQLIKGKANAFQIVAYNENGDILSCEPDTLTIIQGSKIGSATLPYNIGIEIKSLSSGELVFKSIKGLEKNQPTPSVGTVNGLKTQKQIRPGISEDYLKIPIYQGEYGADGSKAIYNEHVYDVIISGEDLPKLLPEGSDVDLTINVDKSERISLSAFFPVLDYTVDITVPTDTTQKEIDAQWLETELSKAEQSLNMVKGDGVADNDELKRLQSELDETSKQFKQGKGDYDKKKETLENLRKIQRKIDSVKEENQWPKTESELKNVFYQLEKTNKEFGDDKTAAIVEQFRDKIPVVVKEKNVKVANELIDNMRQLDFALVDKGLGVQLEISYLKQMNDEFNTLDWKDKNKARMILDQGLKIAVSNPSKEQLRPVIVELFKLLPESQQPINVGGDGSELIG